MQYNNEMLIRELRMYNPKAKVKLMNENEVELDVEFVNFDNDRDIVFIKGFVGY